MWRSVQFTSLRYTVQHNVLRGLGLLEHVGFQSTRRNCSSEQKWSGRLFQVTGAAALKLRLPSSVAVLGTARSPRSAERRPARPERFAVGMQTCWKHAGPAPRIQLNARNAVLNWTCPPRCDAPASRRIVLKNATVALRRGVNAVICRDP